MLDDNDAALKADANQVDQLRQAIEALQVWDRRSSYNQAIEDVLAHLPKSK